MLRGCWVVVLALAACGRSGFESHTDANALGPDGPRAGGRLVFGETPTADVQQVTADTYLDNESTSTNYGASTSIRCERGESNGLLRFDLTAIAAGRPIVSATLRVYVTTTNEVGLTRLSPVLEPWTEGDATNGPGVANWNSRTATDAWTTPGAETPGSAGAEIASFDPSAVGYVEVELSAGTVQGWVDDPTSNAGLLFEGDVRLASSEATAAETRPELVVTFE